MKPGKRKQIAEMNVVPLVDIMLVLLIIFMITAPLMFNGINLKLPKTKRVNQVRLKKTQAVVSLTRAGDIYLGKNLILETEIIKELKSFMKENQLTSIFLRADYGIKYGAVATLISKFKRNGIENISLVTEIKNN